MDWDAAQSVVKEGNSGKYNLKPVIRTIVDQSTGSLKGVVDPDSVQNAVYAILGDDSIGTYTNDEGAFLIKGLDPNTYSVYIDPGTESGIKDTLITDIAIELGIVKDLGELVLEADK